MIDIDIIRYTEWDNIIFEWQRSEANKGAKDTASGDMGEDDGEGGGGGDGGEAIEKDDVQDTKMPTSSNASSSPTLPPPFYHTQLFNELYFLVDGGTIWTAPTRPPPSSNPLHMTPSLPSGGRPHVRVTELHAGDITANNASNVNSVFETSVELQVNSHNIEEEPTSVSTTSFIASSDCTTQHVPYQQFPTLPFAPPSLSFNDKGERVVYANGNRISTESLQVYIINVLSVTPSQLLSLMTCHDELINSESGRLYAFMCTLSTII